MCKGKLPWIALAVVLLLTPRAYAVVTITNPLNITMRNFQTETGGDTTANPNVVNGTVGPLITYTPSNTTGICCGGTYDLSNLSDGDIGIGVLSDGTYGLPNNGGTMTLAFGAMRLVDSLAIYDGYGNRDDGTYTIRDGAGNLLGVWTITGTPGADNNGVDSFWLGFTSPVLTNALQIQIATTDITPSFREIQVFAAAVPEPTTVMMWIISGGSLFAVALFSARRRNRAV